jgi:hypothetical protein
MERKGRKRIPEYRSQHTEFSRKPFASTGEINIEYKIEKIAYILNPGNE